MAGPALSDTWTERSSSNGEAMSSATTELAIPSLDDLYRMTAVPDRRAVIRDVDWSLYERLVDSIPEGARIRVNYDGKDLEIMSLSPFHESNRSWTISKASASIASHRRRSPATRRSPT